MGQALRDIQQVYDEKLDATRNDVETYYNLKVHSHYVINFVVVFLPDAI